MSADSKNYITPQGLAALKEEFTALHRQERPKVVEVVAWAAGNGDRSENGDYIYGKKRLREIDRRLRFLGKRIESAHVVDPKDLKGDKVVFGATVTIEDEDGKQKTYQIVGENEVDVEKGKVSWKSPLAKALLGKKLGDEAMVKRPKEDMFVEITKVKFV